jgi:hypothetical protein
MKFLPYLLFSFNIQKRLQVGTDSDDASVVERTECCRRLLDAARTVGQVGSLASEKDRRMMEDLAAAAIPLSEFEKPARYPLTGAHQLVYSAAPGASSGRLFGNFVGKVSQLFEDEQTFYNRVNFGPVEISLRAAREIMNDTTIKVSFLETSLSVFGKTLVRKETGGGGAWKVKFVGKVKSEDGKEKLVRIMDTPSLFILEQAL